MKRNKFLCILAAAVFFMAGCDLLDRPNPQVMSDDPEFWRTEMNIRSFAQEFYPNFFVGFNTGFVEIFTPVRGLTFCDNLVAFGTPRPFPNAAPAGLGGTGHGLMWWHPTGAPAGREGYGPFWAGPNWNFYWIRKANMMINRLENHSRGHITEDAYNHWRAKARFFRALEYSRLVGVFGDVPWFGSQIDLTDRANLFRDRDPRNFVMDRVYEDFRWVLDNIRTRDRTHIQELNRDVAAAFISRWMLFEGTWQWYHNNDADRAAKFLNFAVEASEYIMHSGRYSINASLRSLFSNIDGAAPAGEVILWRTYRRGQITHSVSAYNNFTESLYAGANLSLISSFITTEGTMRQTVAGEDFNLQNLLETSDPRFEASFARRLRDRSPTGIYDVRFISRNAINIAIAAFENPGNPNYPALVLANNAMFPDYTGSTNTTSFPIIRLGEILLNWIEARAVLAYMGRGPVVTQGDIDDSINLLRRRPIDAQARDLFGLDYTAEMDINNLPNDPRRHVEGVSSALIWEIRRERRMELFQEFPRMLDLRRWNRLENLNTAANPKTVLSTWINFPVELPHLLTPEAATARTVQVKRFNADGTLTAPIVFNGTNHAEMVGFRVMNIHGGNVVDRTDVVPRLNLAPIGTNQINLYREQPEVFTLTQTPGW